MPNDDVFLLKCPHNFEAAKASKTKVEGKAKNFRCCFFFVFFSIHLKLVGLGLLGCIALYVYIYIAMIHFLVKVGEGHQVN